MLKLTKMVYQYDPDNADYMDYYERTLENQIIGSQNPNVTSSMHNGVTYMLPIGPGVTKSYSGDYNSFTCCHGTGMENHVKYQEATYFKKDNTLYVNLYLPTTLNWAEKGLKVTQETQFPSENTKLTVSALGESSSSIDMKFRVPYWATEGFTVKLNGEVKVANPEPSTYVELKGIKAGDVITINMPFTCHLDKTPDKLGSSEVASVMYGPFVMVGKDTSTTMKTLAFSENLSDSIKKDTTSTTVPKLTTNGLSFAPIYDASNYAYTAYFKVITGDPDAKYYEVTTTNTTPSNGSISVSTDLAKEGSNVIITASPNTGYKVKTLLVNGTAVTVAANNTYTVQNVIAKLAITVTFSLINPPTPDPKALDQTATPSAHYTSSWEKLSGINNAAFNPTVSNGGTGKGWGNWSQTTGSIAWVAYTWDTNVTMDTFDIFWYDDGGGTRVPSAISFSYLDSNGSWQPVTMISKYADIIALDKYNTIRIQPVTTSSIRINMTVRSNASGIYRWKVYDSTYVAVTGVTLDKNTLDLAAGGASEQLTAVVAPENATNKNVTWSTNNPSVATVVNGVVTPVAPGTAIITVTTNYGAKKATCTVQVKDKTAPVLNLPSNITAEATGVDGAMVDFNATAHDAVDGDVTVTSTPVSGSTFAIGTTEVECVATDIAGNVATGTFTVTIQDTTAPVLVLPENIVTKATGPNGAAVNFTATANDLVDGDVPVEFTTNSGSTFAPGETIVYCTAKDSSGNEATGSFTVTVKYDFKGFFSPIRMNTINEVNAGSSVPIKFGLGGYMGLNIFEAGSPKIDGDLTVTAGNSALTYDSTTDQYTYVWKTDKAWAGTTKILRIRFNDGTEQEVVFNFK